jgi:short-subunit dehydrogenase
MNVLITGASGGIGYELAKLFARDHHNLLLVARSADRLATVAAELQPHGVNIKTMALDLGTPLAPKFLFDQLQDSPIDILINNAGFGGFGEFRHYA